MLRAAPRRLAGTSGPPLHVLRWKRVESLPRGGGDLVSQHPTLGPCGPTTTSLGNADCGLDWETDLRIALTSLRSLRPLGASSSSCLLCPRGQSSLARYSRPLRPLAHVRRAVIPSDCPAHYPLRRPLVPSTIHCFLLYSPPHPSLPFLHTHTALDCPAVGRSTVSRINR